MNVSTNYDSPSSAGRIGGAAGNSQDARMKAIRNQMTSVQQQIKELSSNQDMPLEEKAEKRKELQQKLQDLNRQLQQRQVEIQQEKRQKVQEQSEINPQQSKKSSEKNTGMNEKEMESFIIAGTSMKTVDTVEGVKTDMEGKAGVLKMEIKTDKSAGKSVEMKEAELADLTGRIGSASAKVMGELSELGKDIKEAGEEEGNEKGDEEENAQNAGNGKANMTEGQYVDIKL